MYVYNFGRREQVVSGDEAARLAREAQAGNEESRARLFFGNVGLLSA